MIHASAAIAVARDVEALRATVKQWRDAGDKVALIPTMGALHEGHASLVRQGQKEARRTIVSIFVNPTQFAPTEDFAAYPRTFETDCAMLAAIGADLVYAPTAAVMYPPGFSSTVSVGGPATVGLEDAYRPQFFAGVATIVAKLLIQSAPDVALFGQKDYQQLQVIRHMVRDLDLPVAIMGAETIREPDGLAMSSRNRYLSETERKTAAFIPAVLRDCAAALRDGSAPAPTLSQARARLERAGFVLDYLELRDAETLAPVAALSGQPARLLVAAKIGTTRLIDNWAV
ncbi:pantoate--beta-alanine ligase [Lichenihabitans psoromatis]|uniref:pantoate--beta-alanine ligase n=1 Tax=Lichenihabitans psoromatis TaxID=2528642 RepID=UPI0010358FB7|nr:pantoate--beta-alanine ligase [Lichenihabitans psoromatis]